MWGIIHVKIIIYPPSPSSIKRTKHSSYLVIVILEENRGRGRISTVRRVVIHSTISRLELKVTTHNEARLALVKITTNEALS